MVARTGLRGRPVVVVVVPTRGHAGQNAFSLFDTMLAEGILYLIVLYAPLGHHRCGVLTLREKRQLHSLMAPLDTSLNLYPHEAPNKLRRNALPTFCQIPKLLSCYLCL